MALTIRYAVTLCIGAFFATTSLLRLVIAFFKKGPAVFSGVKYRSRPRVLLDEKYGKSGFLHLKNLTMHYVAKGDRNKPLLLLVHGFPEFWYSWRHQLNSKLTEEYYVVAIDMRGYGDSDKPHNISDYSINLLANDVKQAIVALGYNKCHLVGHDWGGGVCWSVANRYPEMIEKLAILNCPHYLAFRESLNGNMSQFLKSWYMFMFQLPWFPEWLITRNDLFWMQNVLNENPTMLTKDDMEAFKFTFSQPNALYGPVSYYRASLADNGASRGSNEKIRVPALMIFGAKDKYIGVDTARLSTKYCTNLQFELIANATHWVQQDAPKEVNELLAEFLRFKSQLQKQQQQQQQKLSDVVRDVDGSVGDVVDAAAADVKAGVGMLSS